MGVELVIAEMQRPPTSFSLSSDMIGCCRGGLVGSLCCSPIQFALEHGPTIRST
jgi:hypothetical protein